MRCSSGGAHKSRFFACGAPDFGVDGGPRFGREIAIEPGCRITAGERRLDGNGAGAAKGIDHWAVAVPHTEAHHGGRQRFAQLSLDDTLAVATFV